MAGSSAALYRKKTFIYVTPSPPAELIESTSYTLDFAARKFVQIGVDPTEKFKAVVHFLISSRYVYIIPDFLKKIFSFMGSILSFILVFAKTAPTNKVVGGSDSRSIGPGRQ
jgi:hypothetical protein